MLRSVIFSAAWPLAGETLCSSHQSCTARASSSKLNSVVTLTLLTYDSVTVKSFLSRETRAVFSDLLGLVRTHGLSRGRCAIVSRPMQPFQFHPAIARWFEEKFG